jgi:hypothetical protein
MPIVLLLDIIALLIMIIAAFPDLANRVRINLVALSFAFWMFARLIRA